MPENPFLQTTGRPLTALRGQRGGYVQLAPAHETPHYADLPDSLFFAARAWAACLEGLGACRVYWITLSEVLPHPHIHLYPRWTDTETRGIALFEARETDAQPPWTDAMQHAYAAWAETYGVHPL